MTTMPDNGTVQNVTSPTNTALPHSQNFPTNSGPAQTSPVITDLEDIDLRSKDIRSPNAATAGTAVLQQPNNNNNTIYGYVTQQQLANFGTNVALAKELNT